MAKIICLFNHKGGVSKTTTAFNLGWMMDLKGKRVLLADFDPQCNLTGMVMGFKGVDDLVPIYAGILPNNIKDGLAPAFESQPRQVVPVECVQVAGNDKLFLLPGHISLAEYKTTLGIELRPPPEPRIAAGGVRLVCLPASKTVSLG
jgi:cellulose biosynthesis protein BcsQ